MSGILTKVRNFSDYYPLFRGMVSYAVIWPTCSIVQEYLEHGKSIHEADLVRAARFGFFGTFFMAPVFYGWMKYTSRFFKSKSLKTAIIRASIEQVSYSPLAMAYFFFGMSLLELKPVSTCFNEVKEKFWPTYKIGVIFWPTAQTLNFYFISEKNRIIFVSAASFIWTIYLAHMKGKHQKSLPGIKDDSSDPAPDGVVHLSSDSDNTRPVLKETSSEVRYTLAQKISSQITSLLERKSWSQGTKPSHNMTDIVANPEVIATDTTTKVAFEPNNGDANLQNAAKETNKVERRTFSEEKNTSNDNTAQTGANTITITESDTKFENLDTSGIEGSLIDVVEASDVPVTNETENEPENMTNKEYLSYLFIGI